MTKSVGSCQTGDNLAKAVEIMWQKDCGIVPVVDKKSKVVGTITDRDVTISVFLQNKPASEIPVSEVTNSKVITCSEKDRIEDVLKKMKRKQIKRLPVTKKNGKLVGIISITDILLASGKKKSLRKKVFKTLEAIGKPRPIVLQAVAD
jgi:CBS domain-containing protein